MLQVLSCLTQDHDWRLVILAALICLFASFTAFSLVSRADTARGRVQFAWLIGTAVVTGSGIWATHFVAMLAFLPRVEIGYDLLLTVLSVLLGIAITGCGFAVAVRWQGGGALRMAAAGILVGVGVFAMHFTGMAAMHVAADIDYDTGLVAAAFIIGAVAATGALFTAFGAHARCGDCTRLIATILLTLAIVGLHFTAMGAVTLAPNPVIAVPERAISDEWLAVGVAVTTLLVLAGGLSGSIVDQHLAARSALEASRLRATVEELEQTRSQLDVALARAADGSQAKSQFLAAMSHELRTPLNAVLGFSELLESGIHGQLNSKQTEYTRDIHRAGAHLLALVNNVLDITKLDSGHFTLHDEEIDLGEPIGEAVKMVELFALSGDVAVVADLDSDLPRVMADLLRIRQAVLNLLSNAVKFSPPGGRVVVSARRRDDGSIAIAVADNGIGMAPEDIPKAFERFVQIDSRFAGRYEGTGLGLPLTRRLIELHGGSIEIKSARDVGTTVTIVLPAARVVAEQERRSAAA
jgi:signal transduction histidine kinase